MACLVSVPVMVVPRVLSSLVPPVVLVLPSVLNRDPSVLTLLMMVGRLTLVESAPTDLLTLWPPIPSDPSSPVNRLSPVARLRQ